MSKFVQDTKLILNHRFPEIVDRNHYAVVPVVTRDGHIKELKIAPGAEPRKWLDCDWERTNGRPTLLKSVSLTTDRLVEGCVFLEAAYLAEGWEDGWRQYKSFMDAQYIREETDDSGRTHRVNRRRTQYVGHFPDDMLPKSVLAMRGAKAKAAPKWTPSPDVKRPEDKAGQSQPEPSEPAVKAKGAKGA